MQCKFIRRPELENLLGISRAEIYRRIQQGTLPTPIHIGKRAVAWLDLEIQQLQAALITGANSDDLSKLVKRMQNARGQHE